MAIEIIKFRKYKKGPLEGFLTVLLPTVGLEIRDCQYLIFDDGKKSVGLPSRPYEKEDGTTGYANICKFPDKDKYQAFQQQAVQAIEDYLSKAIGSTPDGDIPF